MQKRIRFSVFVLVLCITSTAVNVIECTEYNDTYTTEYSSALATAECDTVVPESPLSQYPEVFTEEQLRHGWIVLHFIGAIYFFVTLGIICNDYFLPTVECICEDLNLSKDVAAATFMASATAMPEFFTNCISTLLTDSNLGLGTVVGSLMFNTLGVASLAAMFITKPVQLDWWPITRDCFIYSFNIIILFILAFGGYVTFVESCIMMGFLIIYYIVTFNNNKFMPAIRVFIEDKMNCCFDKRYDFTEPPENSAKAKLPLKKDPLNGDGLFVISLPETTSTTSSTHNLTTQISWSPNLEPPKKADKLFALPRGETTLMKCWWGFTFPIRLLISCIVPNPLKIRKLYPLCFIMCIICIGLLAYMISWMLTSIGVVLNIPSIVMGLTFLAIGSTTPETVSSIMALRGGENGIGVSNSLGSNSLAILISLGIPWFIKNIMNLNTPGAARGILIASDGVEIAIIILLIATFSLFIVLSLVGYRLRKRVGVMLFSIYLVLITLQVLNAMGVWFPDPVC